MGLIKEDSAPQMGKAEFIPSSVLPMPAGVHTLETLQNKLSKGRDFDAEARGKTRCALYGAAVSGLGVSLGMTIDWNSEESVNKFVALCKKVADEGVTYSFEGK